MSHDGFDVYQCDGWIFSDRNRVHVRVREALNMEDLVVGLVALGLLIYLVAALIRPEKF